MYLLGITLPHSVRVFVDLGIKHVTRMRHIVICGLSDSTVYFHIIL